MNTYLDITTLDISTHLVHFIRYFITSDRGILGCIMFCGASKSLKLRDKWIGWTTRQKARNQGWVINNNRFLILPWVQVKNLASHVLGKVTRRISKDWLERWGFEPVLMETFVDPEFYAGSCYKAANWQYLGNDHRRGPCPQRENLFHHTENDSCHAADKPVSRGPLFQGFSGQNPVVSCSKIRERMEVFSS